VSDGGTSGRVRFISAHASRGNLRCAKRGKVEPDLHRLSPSHAARVAAALSHEERSGTGRRSVRRESCRPPDAHKIGKPLVGSVHYRQYRVSISSQLLSVPRATTRVRRSLGVPAAEEVVKRRAY